MDLSAVSSRLEKKYRVKCCNYIICIVLHICDSIFEIFINLIIMEFRHYQINLKFNDKKECASSRKSSSYALFYTNPRIAPFKPISPLVGYFCAKCCNL